MSNCPGTVEASTKPGMLLSCFMMLSPVVLTGQYRYAEGHLALELLGRLNTVEAGVSVSCPYVADLADSLDCLLESCLSRLVSLLGISV